MIRVVRTVLCLGLLIAAVTGVQAAPKHSVFGACVDKGLAPCTVQSAKCTERCHSENNCLTACKKSFAACRNDVIQTCQRRGQTGHINPPQTHVAPR